MGKLTLPQGGNHCYIKVVSCYGFSVSVDGTQNANRANPSNYVMDIYIYSSDGTASIGLEDWTAPAQGCYHYGFVQSSSIYTRGLTVFLCPDYTDPKNVCQIWMLSYKKHGKPLVIATCSGVGSSFDTSVQTVDSFLPNTGHISIRTASTLTDLTPISLTPLPA